MSKIIVITLLFAGLLFVNAPAKAQTQDPLPELPNAGLTPESPFYFLDKLGETLQDFFTFNPEGKARLQIKFAAERIAEIQIVFEKKGVEAEGIEVAQNRLLAHLASASAILATQKSKGEDVNQLAVELNNNLGASKSSLKDTFKEQKQTLKAQEDSLKAQLRAAHKAGNIAEEEALAAKLGQVKAQLELIDLKEEDIEDDIEDEEENIEEAMEAKAEAESKIRKAEREKEEVVREAQKEGVELPANSFGEFDALLSRAKAAFASENFVEAKRLAKQAKDSLEIIEERIDELEDMLEAKEEAEEAIVDAEEELAEVRAEAKKEGVEFPESALAEFNNLLSQAKAAFAAEEFEKAKRLAKQAEDALEDAEETIERLEEERGEQEERVKEEGERKEEAIEKERKQEQEKQSDEKDEINKQNEEGEENGASSVPGPRIVTVSMRSGRFDDNVVDIRRGDTVQWTNRDSQPHWPASNVHPTHTNLPGFDALRPLSSGESYEFTFTQSGTFGYHDHLNPSVTGQVIVK